MANFSKNEDCPPSQLLLEFQDGEIELEDGAEIRRHLTACEFCAAEVEFYSHYPQSDEQISETKIPEPLYELADALLRRRADLSKLYGLIDQDHES